VPNAVLVNTTLISGTSPITGCSTVQVVCPEGSVMIINADGIYNEYYLQYDQVDHTFECGPTGYFGFSFENYDKYSDKFSDDYIAVLNITSIQCYTLRKLNSRK
jgi:hypothetical protein